MEIKSGLNITDCISLINGRVETTINRFLDRKLKENNIGITKLSSHRFLFPRE